MSVFPKKILAGECVIVHNAFHTSKFEEGIYFPLLEIWITDPDGIKKMVHSKVTPIIAFDSQKTEEIYQHNQTTKYKQLPLVALSNYLCNYANSEDLVNTLQALKSGRHYYFSYQLPLCSSPGKYKVEAIHYLNGEKYASRDSSEDVFYVERIEVSYLKKHVLLKNNSNESTSIKLIFLDSKHTIISYSTTLMKGGEKLEVNYKTKCVLMYNEDRKVIPLFTESTRGILKNPKLPHIIKNKSKPIVTVFGRDSADAFQLEDEYYQLWNASNGFASKHKMEATKQVDEMLEEQLLIEFDY
jgi:hypothetical protein